MIASLYHCGSPSEATAREILPGYPGQPDTPSPPADRTDRNRYISAGFTPGSRRTKRSRPRPSSCHPRNNSSNTNSSSSSDTEPLQRQPHGRLLDVVRVEVYRHEHRVRSGYLLSCRRTIRLRYPRRERRGSLSRVGRGFRTGSGLLARCSLLCCRAGPSPRLLSRISRSPGTPLCRGLPYPRTARSRCRCRRWRRGSRPGPGVAGRPVCRLSGGSGAGCPGCWRRSSGAGTPWAPRGVSSCRYSMNSPLPCRQVK